MKNGTLYASRLKRAYTKQRQAVPKPDIPEPVDPLTCLATAVLAEESSDAEAKRAVDRILTSMVESDGLVELLEDQASLDKGDMVRFLPFSEVVR